MKAILLQEEGDTIKIVKTEDGCKIICGRNYQDWNAIVVNLSNDEIMDLAKDLYRTYGNEQR